MNKLFYTFVICHLTLIAVSQCRVDSTLFFKYDLGSTTKEPLNLTVYSYNLDNSIGHEILFHWDKTHSVWNSTNQTEYAYNGEGMLTEELTQEWNVASNS